MKVEIDNTREIKEVVINQDGTINIRFPEYAGHIAKIVIINQKGQIVTTPIETKKVLIAQKPSDDPNRIEGLRHQEGLPRSRQTAKDFAKLISHNCEIAKKDLSWIELKNGTHIRYSNSVIYGQDDGDLLWYSLSYKDLAKHMKDAAVYLAFLIRESQNLVYVKASEVIDIFKNASELRKNDWLHIHLFFTEGKLKMELKTGAGNEPIETELSFKETYVAWNKFIKVLGNSDGGTKG